MKKLKRARHAMMGMRMRGTRMGMFSRAVLSESASA